MLSFKPAFDPDRRRALRMESDGAADARVVDDGLWPIISLDNAQMVDVASGGLAINTHSEIQVGCRLDVRTPPTEQQPDGALLVLEIANTTEHEPGCWRLGCRLVEGSIPVTMAAAFR